MDRENVTPDRAVPFQNDNMTSTPIKDSQGSVKGHIRTSSLEQILEQNLSGSKSIHESVQSAKQARSASFDQLPPSRNSLPVEEVKSQAQRPTGFYIGDEKLKLASECDPHQVNSKRDVQNGEDFQVQNRARFGGHEATPPPYTQTGVSMDMENMNVQLVLQDEELDDDFFTITGCVFSAFCHTALPAWFGANSH